MTLKEMCKLENSKVVQTTIDISASSQEIEVSDISVFKKAPNYVTLGTDNDAEVVKYYGIDIANKKLTNCLRGQSYTVSKGWEIGTDIANTLTSETLNNIIDNIEGLGDASNQTSSDLSNLVPRVSEAESNISSIDTKLSKAQTDITTNSTNITNLTARMSAAESALGADANTLSGLREDLTDAETAISKNTVDIKAANDSIDEIGATLATKTGVYGAYKTTIKVTDWKLVNGAYVVEIKDSKIPADTSDVVYFVDINFDDDNLKLIPRRIKTSTKQGAFIMSTAKIPKGAITGTVLLFEVLKGMSPTAGGMNELFDYIDEQMTQIKSTTKDYVDEQISTIETVIQHF